jgi:hypothetical protein
MVQWKTATDKVYDFQPVPFPKLRLRPLLARDDVAIEFDGDAILLHAQLLYQGGKRQRKGEIAGFAINLQRHLNWIFAVSAAHWQINQGEQHRTVRGPLQRSQLPTLRSRNFRVVVRPE